MSAPVKGVLLARPPAKAPVTPHAIVASLLDSPATALIPRGGLPATEVQFLSQWTPGAIVATVPRAAVSALTPKSIADQFTPTALAQNATYDLATAAILAMLM